MRWQAAEARAKQLEGRSRVRPASRRARQPPAKMSPAALSAHRRQCAARARLYRRGLSLAARRRVVDQARAADAVPHSFDVDMFLAGRGPKDDAPEVDAAEAAANQFIAAYPDDLPPDASPQVHGFWIAVRLAELEDRLPTDDLELMRDFETALPSLLANETPRPRGYALLNYRGTAWRIARDAWGSFLYPNGQPSGSAAGSLFYSSGFRACDASSGIWYYPDGWMLTNGSGSWWTPDHRPTTLPEMVARIGEAAGALGPVVALGLGRIRQPAIWHVALLELAWWYLRP